MKKVLLSSVAALAVFAAVAPALADDAIPFGGPNGVLSPAYVQDPANTPATLDAAREAGNAAQQENSKAKTGEANNAVVEPKKDANGNVIENEFVLRDKDQKDAKADAKKADDKKADAKAPAAAAGQKALPKTSAVK